MTYCSNTEQCRSCCTPLDVHQLVISTFRLSLAHIYRIGKQLKDSVKELNILIYFFFPSITQSCSVSDVLFTGGRGVSDFSVLKYYQLNSVNILNECQRIPIDCSQLSKTYYNVLFGSFTRNRHADAYICGRLRRMKITR